MHEWVASILVGLLGGLASGLLGVSPGGILVPVAIMLLGADQHIAQSLSLIAQIPPTSFAGLRRYWSRGSRTPIRWLVPLAGGFLMGGVAGALLAVHLSRTVLQWTFVGYLSLLDVLLIVRARHAYRSPGSSSHRADAIAISSLAFALVGFIAGVSSGLMGIGGGLAITVGLGAVLKLPQHQSQAVSLVMAMIPLTLPSALIYWQQGWAPSWIAILGVIAGLWVGTDVGARVANAFSESLLRVLMIGLVAAMAIYMAYRALE
jgi:uncharacterized membrane protein YfcA